MVGEIAGRRDENELCGSLQVHANMETLAQQYDSTFEKAADIARNNPSCRMLVLWGKGKPEEQMSSSSGLTLEILGMVDDIAEKLDSTALALSPV